jgi:hypothetical protein
MVKPPQPLPLNEIRAGLLGKDFEDLRWFFTESGAAQSGLKSSQSSFEHKMISGIGQPPASYSFDGRLLAHIERAKVIEARIRSLAPVHVRSLMEYFTRIQPLVDRLPTDRQGRKTAKSVMRGVSNRLARAMRAYAGSQS